MREEEEDEKGNNVENEDVFSQSKSRARFSFKESSYFYVRSSDDTTALVSHFLSLLPTRGSLLDQQMVSSLARSRLAEAIVKYISTTPDGGVAAAGGTSGHLHQQQQRSAGLLQELRDACLVLEESNEEASNR